MPKEGKPRGKMTSYAFFVQTCREEHKRKHPGEQVVFSEFSKKCAEKWKLMTGNQKQRFEQMAEKDKARYEQELSALPAGAPGKAVQRKRKATKDPNKPKRSLSGFFFFCNEERGRVKALYPSYGVGDVSKELGKRWEVCPNKAKYEAMAVKDKERYDREIAAYRAGGGGAAASAKAGDAAKKGKPAASKASIEPEEDEEEEEAESD